MIHYVEGPIEYQRGDAIVIAGHGMAWSINMTQGLANRLDRESDSNVRIYTYMHVREDILALYGFPTYEDVQLFEILMSVTGVGPKLAQAILDQMTPDRFALAIMHSDIKVLTTVKGLGKKTAERLILELKDKLKAPEWLQGLEDAPEDAEQHSDDEAFQAVLEALGVLGYAGKEASEMASKYYDEAQPVDVNIREILRLVGQARRELSRR